MFFDQDGRASSHSRAISMAARVTFPYAIPVNALTVFCCTGSSSFHRRSAQSLSCCDFSGSHVFFLCGKCLPYPFQQAHHPGVNSGSGQAHETTGRSEAAHRAQACNAGLHSQSLLQSGYEPLLTEQITVKPEIIPSSGVLPGSAVRRAHKPPQYSNVTASPLR